MVDVVKDRVSRSSGPAETRPLLQQLNNLQEKHDKLNLNFLNQTRALASARASNHIHTEILDAIATGPLIPGLQRLIATAKKKSFGASAILERIRKAASGKYHARSYSPEDRDLATLMYELGGAGAVYALNHASPALPSLKTLRSGRQKFALKVTVRDVRISDTMENIRVLYRSDGSQRVPHSLPIDEVAGDGRLCYLPESDDMGGLCREHCHALETVKMGSNMTSVRNAAIAVKEGKVHIGKEFTVVAVARHAEKNYGAKPIIISPTCKQGSWEDMARVIQKAISAWKLSLFGHEMSGPLFCISSDGDATRRAAMYHLCMSHEVQPTDPLFQFIGNLPGLNLFTGEDYLTMDFDYKHIFKRICTLLCSKEGMVVNDVVINKVLISQWLEYLTEHDWSDASIHALLNPKDAQDVPRAIMLLNRMGELLELDNSDFDPSERIIHDALGLLGEALNALVDPFINPDMSLSEQITLLIKCAFIMAALFRKHETSFMSNQLYGDIQCMIKNAVFQIAKTRNLDPTLKVFLCLLGDDVLEALFGRIRMIGGHSPNVDISETEHRIRSSLIVGHIYGLYPEWERRSERLRMVRNRDVDHLRPRCWEADVVAANCDLKLCWDAAMKMAMDVLRRYGINVDFRVLFSQKGFDLMRPKGGKKYPGVSTDVDRSLADVYSCPDSEAPGIIPPSLPSDPIASSHAPFDAHAILAAEQSEDDEISTGTSIWMNIDDTHVQHKKTVLRTIFDPTEDNDYGKAHDRLLRCRNYSIGGDKWDRTGGLKRGEDLDAFEKFSIGDLFATLIRVNNTEVGLAIAQATIIKYSPPGATTTSISCAPRDEISSSPSSYSISGQILSMVPFLSEPQEEENEITTEGGILWAWDGWFVGVEAVKQRKTKKAPAPHAETSKKAELNFTVPASLFVPLVKHRNVMEVESCDLPTNLATTMKAGLETTWTVTELTMFNLRTQLWDRVKEPNCPLQTCIPTYGRVFQRTFPYASVNNQDESLNISHKAGTLEATAIKADQKLPCRVCGKDVVASDRQNHMGKHILHQVIGVPDPTATREAVSSDYPCGFCGGLSTQDGTCTVGFGPGGKVSSTCPAVYNLVIAHAAKVSNSKPCTNVPIKCGVFDCTEVHWKYNMRRHLTDRHPAWERRDTSGIASRIEITRDELNGFHMTADSISLTAGGTAAQSAPSRTGTIPPPLPKRPARSPPGTPSTRRREEEVQRKSRRTTGPLPPHVEQDDDDVFT